MKKNWFLFILMVIFAYSWLLYDNYHRTAAHNKAIEQYKADWEAWHAEQEIKRAQRYEQIQGLAGDRGTAAAAQPRSADEPSTTTASGTGATISQGGDSPRLLAIDSFERHLVETDLYRVEFTELGARPVSWQIKSSDYVTNRFIKGSKSTEGPVEIIPQVGDRDMREYPLELTGVTARDFNSIPFTVERSKTETGVVLRFTSVPFNDLVVVKEYQFSDKNFHIDVTVTYVNGQTTRKTLGRERGFGIGWQGGFESPGASDRVHGEPTLVASMKGDLDTRTLRSGDTHIELKDGLEWAGIEKKFFAAILLPEPTKKLAGLMLSIRGQNDSIEYQTRGSSPPLSLDLYHPRVELEPGMTHEQKFQVYVGPKNLESLREARLEIAAGALEPTGLVFHWVPLKMNWLRPMCLMLLKLLKWLEHTFGSWGFAIICTTIIVRLAVYPLTHWAMKNQARTMFEQKKVRPELEVIFKKYAKDPMKKNQAMMQLYRDHNISPFGFARGCFPILLQMPIFLGLYVVFDQSVELRGKSFLWIEDLSAPDRFFVWGVNVPLIGDSLHLLPILMSVTNFIQMRLMHMPAADEAQERIQKQMQVMMPIMFLFFLYSLPSGLILYWVVSNIWGIAQGWLTKRYVAAHEAQHGAAGPPAPARPSAA